MKIRKNSNPRAIVFGAGGGGKKFIQNCKDKYDFIAFSDNDRAKFGTFIDNLPVIKPEEIIDKRFDIVIIASMWVKEISDQLIELGVDKEKINVPPKNQLKSGTPFVDPSTKDFGRDLIFWITELLGEHEIDGYVDFGTLLGFVRDGDILDWDDDIDMSVNDFDYERMAEIIQNNSSDIPGTKNVKWKGSIVFDNDGNKYGLLLDCIPNHGSQINPFDLYIRSRRRKDGFSIPMGAVGNLFIPEMHFNGHDILNVKELRLKAPKDYQDYLTLVYGDWRTPKKGVDFTFYKPIDMKPFGKTDESPLQYKILFG